MAKTSGVRVNRRSQGSGAVLLVILLLLAGVAAAISLAWQRAQNKNPIYNLPKPPASSSPVASLPTESSSEPSSEPSSEAPPEEPEQPEESLFGRPLPQSTRVTGSYFDDALFIGDSITTGLELYDILPDTTVVASTGINLDTILSAAVMDSPTGKETILQSAARHQPKKIYVMLGANGLGFLSSEQTVDLYGRFVDQLRAQHPEAIIYIQSILPIEESLFAQKYQGKLNNEKIDACNALLLEMAGEKQMYYLDVAEALKDATGGLPAAATSDGLHFKSEYYIKWTDYLKTHVVTED